MVVSSAFLSSHVELLLSHYFLFCVTVFGQCDGHLDNSTLCVDGTNDTYHKVVCCSTFRSKGYFDNSHLTNARSNIDVRFHSLLKKKIARVIIERSCYGLNIIVFYDYTKVLRVIVFNQPIPSF